jgi:adenine C2-methylase RlmN of 23S rRNA A2503 and tRNA A37
MEDRQEITWNKNTKSTSKLRLMAMIRYIREQSTMYSLTFALLILRVEDLALGATELVGLLESIPAHVT